MLGANRLFHLRKIHVQNLRNENINRLSSRNLMKSQKNFNFFEKKPAFCSSTKENVVSSSHMSYKNNNNKDSSFHPLHLFALAMGLSTWTMSSFTTTKNTKTNFIQCESNVSKMERKLENDAPQRSMLRHHLSQMYDINKLIGKGGFGEVNSGRHKKSDTAVAIKKMPKRSTSEEKFRREVNILRQVGGKYNVIELRDAFETPDAWVIVTELARGGELFDHLVEKGAYSEKDASKLIREVCTSLKFLHSHHIAHADIKPENIVLTSPSGYGVRLVDFGLAFRVSDIEEQPCFMEGSGTVAYLAPELLEGKSATCVVDMWSLGVVAYILLTGVHPFDRNNTASDDEITRQILRGQYDLYDSAWTNISPAAKDLIKNMLETDPMKRITAEEALNHPWLAHTENLSELPLSVSSDSLRKFQRGKQRLCASIMALIIRDAGKDGKDASTWLENFLEDETKEVERTLSVLDRDLKGYIDSSDLKRVASELGDTLSDTEAEEMILGACDDPSSMKTTTNHIQYADIAQIVYGLRSKGFKQGEYIISQGTTSEDFYVLLDGQVECLLETKPGSQPAVLSKIETGMHFGETELVLSAGKESKRLCSCRCATEKCRVLAIDPSELANVTGVYENVDEKLHEEARRNVHEVLVNYFAQGMVSEVISKSLAADNVVYRQGELCDKFYVIKSGQVSISHESSDGTTTVENLQEGDFFPLGIIDKQVKRDFTVTCQSNVELIEVGGDAFRNFLQGSNVLSTSVRDEINLRRKKRSHVLAGEQQQQQQQ